MLNTQRVRASLTVLTLAAAGLVLAATPAYADYVYCPPEGGDCYIVVTDPGGGGGGGGGGDYVCRLPPAYGSRVVPCYDADFGWYNPNNTCYFKEYTPAAGDPNYPDPGPGRHYYTATCSLTGTPWPVPTVVGPDTPPPGYGGMPAPLVLATQAINRMALRGPDIIISPQPAGAGLVGLPVWLATAVNENTWGPNTKSAAVPGLSVTAIGRAQKIVWKMGDGTTITCTSHGRAWTKADRDTMPSCGHRYTRSSRTQPGGRYTITGTTTWEVTWTASDGQSGTLTVTRESSTTVRIDELQVVTR